MQAPTSLTIGNTGITVPVIPGPGSVAEEAACLVKVILRVPTLNAGTHTFATSDDGGASWVAASGPIALTGYEKPNPTAATDAGGWRQMYGPYLPGTLIRLTSSVSQADKTAPSVYFGL
jgi:hypothetical protein